MTLRKLSEVYYIDREIKRDRKELERLRERSLCISPALTGMPSAQSNENKIEKYAAAITDLEAAIAENEIKQIEVRLEITKWINAITDSQTRLIFKLRFLWLMDWYSVAEQIGGGNTADSVKKRCYRYLK